MLVRACRSESRRRVSSASGRVPVPARLERVGEDGRAAVRMHRRALRRRGGARKVLVNRVGADGHELRRSTASAACTPFALSSMTITWSGSTPVVDGLQVDVGSNFLPARCHRRRRRIAGEGVADRMFEHRADGCLGRRRGDGERHPAAAASLTIRGMPGRAGSAPDRR